MLEKDVDKRLDSTTLYQELMVIIIVFYLFLILISSLFHFNIFFKKEIEEEGIKGKKRRIF